MKTFSFFLLSIFALAAVAAAGKHGRKHGRGMRNRFNKVNSPLFPYLYPEFGGYASNLRPNYRGEPVKVTLTSYIRDISDYCTHKGELTLQLTLRMAYVDPRLAFTPSSPLASDTDPTPAPNPNAFVTLVGEETKRIWLPDVFVRNSRSASMLNMLAPETMARVDPDGTVKYSARVNLVTTCAALMKTTEEEETVTCPIHLASYGLNANDLTLAWGENDPVKFSNEYLSIKGGATLESVSQEIGAVETATATYNWAGMNLTFRKPGK